MNYVLTNEREEIVFGTDFVITSIDERGPEIRGEENNILEGFGYNELGSSLGGRKITLEGYVTGEETGAKKRLLNRIVAGSGDYFYLKDGETRLKCRLYSGVEYGKRKHAREKTTSFRMTLYAPYPAWEETEDTELVFYSCSSSSKADGPIEIVNSGDVLAGMLIRLVFLVDTTDILLSNGDEFISVKGSFTTGDSLYIDTRRGQARAYVVYKNKSEEVNAMKYMSLESTLFKLNVGQNLINFELYGGVAHMSVTYRQGYLK